MSKRIKAARAPDEATHSEEPANYEPTIYNPDISKLVVSVVFYSAGRLSGAEVFCHREAAESWAEDMRVESYTVDVVHGVQVGACEDCGEKRVIYRAETSPDDDPQHPLIARTSPLYAGEPCRCEAQKHEHRGNLIFAYDTSAAAAESAVKEALAKARARPSQAPAPAGSGEEPPDGEE
jgi:hypothetical protein